jgi:hypothetical protein
MKPKFHQVLDMCIENGIKLGVNRAFKHDEHPSREVIETSVFDAISGELYEWFDFEEHSDALS